jgi:two-component system sensor histidine kinase DesK
VHGFRTARLSDEIARARAVLETAGVRVQTDSTPPSAALIADVEHAAAMILREAVTNVVRHAKATSCRITASTSEGRLVLQIQDDGVGGPLIAGAGIESMRARAREIGGTLDHHTHHGVTVTLRVPASHTV